MHYWTPILFTVVAIAFALLAVLGILLPRSLARHVINGMGDAVLRVFRITA